ncbi:DEAD/DEAH box helicase [Candidatus Woesearchaeota archaeon]|jgi:superfamily II DNA/RNA helicase|nr:DEAD/DEAH box helicase [Candidatus Woesearchaeota archaeon]MBT6520278.1 DEAD/DEAH box helicase [Candidatus Woesearchaeota archaeon]MBT7367298.1 DEAD/DEAH box helicase [Candidatus Woesearchaeota archaeon]
MTFEKLNVNKEIVKALTELEIIEPTQIQELTIPLIQQGQDVIGMSKTGSGKTASFGVPLLEKVIPNQGVQVLIIAPTRELAVQISNELKKFGKYMKIKVATIFGGVAIGPQMEALTKSEIVVGTPGRLLDHLQRTTLDLSKTKHVVLDEADKMVDMGFIEDINLILSNTPKNKQMILFGATISNEIERIKQQHMNDPKTAKAESRVQDDLLEQYYYNIESREKFSLLVHLLKKENIQRAIIFCSARTTVDIVARNLKNAGINAESIHGKITQNKRLEAIEQFNKGQQKILVASAVAARGLDIKDVTHVFNYDLPQDPQEYIHRIGRTARAGESGKAITLLCDRDFESFNAILGKYSVNVQLLPKEDFKKVRFEVGRRNDRSGPGRFGHSGNRSGGFSSAGSRPRSAHGGHGRSFKHRSDSASSHNQHADHNSRSKNWRDEVSDKDNNQFGFHRKDF